MTRRSRPLAAAALVLAGAAAAASCEIHPPELTAVSARLFVEPAEGGRREKLSFFVSVRDEDGAADLEYLFLVHDGAELSWELDASTWARKDEGDTVWIGSSALCPPTGTAMPRGEYRALVVDMAGERSEYRFSLLAPDGADYALPSVALAGEDAVTVSSPYPLCSAFFLDAGGNVVRTANAANGRISLDALWKGSSGSASGDPSADGGWRTGSDYLAVYGLDPASDMGFFSWKIRLPD